MPWSIDRDRREETLRQVFRTDRREDPPAPSSPHHGEKVFGGQRERSRLSCPNIGTRKSQYNRPLHEEISRATGGVVGEDQLLGVAMTIEEATELALLQYAHSVFPNEHICLPWT